MKIITVVSPDKLSMTMFCSFYESIYVGDRLCGILDINCLFSKETQGLKTKEFIELNRNADFIIIKYKVKSNTKLSLPLEIENNSDYIVKFDMFSNHPDLIKDADGKGVEIIDRYNKNIDLANKMGY